VIGGHFSDVLEARRRIAGALGRTPLVGSGWLSRRLGAEVRLKLESLQETHSFKTRGALNAVARLAGERGAEAVVTASAGNHGLAIAWAAARLGVGATIFTPRAAPRAKLDAIRACEADLRPVADDYEHAEALALAWSTERRTPFISPYNHSDVIAGAGTVALEIVEDWPDVDTLLAPVGGGGLISGIAITVRALKRQARVIGVEAAASAAFTAARRAGRLVTIEVSPTIADGLGGNIEPGSMTWPIVRDLVNDVETVSEQELADGIAGLMAQERLIAEGAGIAAVAALASGRIAVQGRRVALVVSGANIDPERLKEAL